jgi:hypothetical protein
VKILKNGAPNLKDSYAAQNSGLAPGGWWIGATFECPCGAEFELEVGDKAEESPGSLAVRCPHCKMLHNMSYGRIYPLI